MLLLQIISIFMNTTILLQIDTVLSDTTEQAQAVLKDIDPFSVFYKGILLLLIFALLYMGVMKLVAVIDKRRNRNMPIQEDENEDIT